jgi:hypothetical protein
MRSAIPATPRSGLVALRHQPCSLVAVGGDQLALAADESDVVPCAAQRRPYRRRLRSRLLLYVGECLKLAQKALAAQCVLNTLNPHSI